MIKKSDLSWLRKNKFRKVRGSSTWALVTIGGISIKVFHDDESCGWWATVSHQGIDSCMDDVLDTYTWESPKKAVDDAFDTVKRKVAFMLNKLCHCSFNLQKGIPIGE